MKFQRLTVLAAIVALSVGSLPASASSGISYTETAWSTQAAAPDAYTATERYGGYQIGDGVLTNPQDVCTDEKGNLYIADTDNNRIILVDADMKPIRMLTAATREGDEEFVGEFNKPEGVYVRDGYLYVADTGNSRVLKMTFTGEVKTVYERPESTEFTTEFYTPTKVAVDRDGIVFVLCRGVYQGSLLYENDGRFQAFFGSAQVQATWQVILDKTWKKLLSRKQRSSMADYVPVEYDNLVADDDGFLYVCSRNTDGNREQIRKLNYLGNNVYPYTENFGEQNSVYYEQKSIVTTFSDVAISSNGIMYALDDTRGRVYAFNEDGDRLFSFGGLGEMMGTFQKASSVAVFGDTVYVLDSQNGTVTVFEPTEYGDLLIRATACFAEGKFEETRELWQKLLSCNSNLELAYRGMGESLLKSGNYKESLEYFRLGNDPERESVAFSHYRAQLIRDNPVAVSAAALLLLVVSLILTRKQFWRKRRERRAKRAQKQYGPIGSMFRDMGQVLSHPVATMTEMKYKRYRNWLMVLFVVLWWFVVRIGIRELTGFRFVGGDEELNIFLELLFSVVPFALFCLSNWACCSIMSGEGRFDEICTFTAMGMIPYLIFQTLGIPLSNVLCLAEKDFYQWFLIIGTLWSVFLVFQAVRIVHQYSTLKSVFLIILSLFGIVVILFLLLLVVALGQQMYSFGITLYSELSYQG